MRRREFVWLLSGAAAWPLAARAQQPAKLPTIGFLGSSTPSAMSQWTAAFVQRLRDLGWIEGRTVVIEYRWAEGSNSLAAEIAAEFVQLKVNVIITYATSPVLAAKQATSVIPIVFAASSDAVGAGLVASLARPGGNITGLSLQQTMLLASVSNSCARPCPVCADWRSWPILAIRPSFWKCTRFSQRPMRSALRSSHPKFGSRRISRPPSTRSRAAWTHFMFVPTRS